MDRDDVKQAKSDLDYKEWWHLKEFEATEYEDVRLFMEYVDKHILRYGYEPEDVFIDIYW